MKSRKGFTLVEIMIVVAIIGLLAAIAIPSFMRNRTVTQMNSCINNLRQIEAAKDQLAMETGLTNGAETSIANLVGRDNFIKQWPVCPSYNPGEGGSKTGQNATVASYGQNQVIGSNATCLVMGTDANYPHMLPLD
ncbi:MAG: type II secretion system protein [Kiritimatiellia bacterium]|jgi:prepilin-type N-terminal cleavage/methylation domain-containing protein